jgi:DNA transformation protein and related proteins
LNFELSPVTKTTRRPSTPRRLNPLKVSDGFRAFVLDQFEELGDVTPKAMFGGVGLYHNGLFFGILAGDVLYLKADDRTRPIFERAGSKPFKPYPDRSGTMQYYSVPIGVLESGLELARWARAAVAAATRASEQPDRDHQRKRREGTKNR